MDMEADAFLSQRNTNLTTNTVPTTTDGLFAVDDDQPGQIPLLKPPPFPLHHRQHQHHQQHKNTDTTTANPNTGATAAMGLFELREYQRRRAWLDVLHRGLEMLTLSSSPYEPFYAAILHSTPMPIPIPPSPSRLQQQQQQQQQQTGDQQILEEFVEIVQLRLKAMIKLRRFDDLQREIHRLSLTTTASFLYSSSPSHTSSHDTTLQDKYALSLLHSGQNSLIELVLDATAALQYTTSPQLTVTPNNKDRINNTNNPNTPGPPQTVTSSCIDSLQALRSTSILPTSRLRIKCSAMISNLFVRERDFRSALAALEDILHELDSFGDGIGDDDIVGATTGTTRSEAVRWTRVMGRVEVHSRQGRILLQVGALPAAATIFERAHDEFDAALEECGGEYAGGVVAYVRRGRTQILLNEGLLFFGHMDYAASEGKFCGAVRLQRATPSVPVPVRDGGGYEAVPTTTRNPILLDVEEELVAPALNNMALCALYTCRMGMAVDLFEGLIREDPTRYLTECMVFNLCTLYELGSDHAVSERKKRILQLVAKRFSLHDVGSDCFRLN